MRLVTGWQAAWTDSSSAVEVHLHCPTIPSQWRSPPAPRPALPSPARLCSALAISRCRSLEMARATWWPSPSASAPSRWAGGRGGWVEQAAWRMLCMRMPLLARPFPLALPPTPSPLTTATSASRPPPSHPRAAPAPEDPGGEPLPLCDPRAAGEAAGRGGAPGPPGQVPQRGHCGVHCG